MLPVLRMDVQGPLYWDNSNKMQKLQGTIILQTNFIHIYVLKYIFLSSNILSISLYNCMKNEKSEQKQCFDYNWVY